MKYLSSANPENLKGTAILRLDLNTEDDSRLKASLPTLKFLLKFASKIVVLSHKGRPFDAAQGKPGPDPKLSLKPAADSMRKLLGREVVFVPNLPASSRELADGPIFLLENLRFFPEEEADDEAFAQKLASLGDFYVNDAFAVSHRANASVHAIVKFLPSYAGLELEKEVTNLGKVMQNPERPFVLVLGGAKAEDKLPIAKFLKDKLDSVLLGGAPANTLLKLKGVDVDGSLVADKPEDFKEFLDYPNIILPEDWKMGDGKIWDIGPKTEEAFVPKIKAAKTIVWNGPLGMFEESGFEAGTRAVIQSILESSAFAVIGGGETVSAFNLLKPKSHDLKANLFVSTGGGAMLEFLAGEELPGIKALE